MPEDLSAPLGSSATVQRILEPRSVAVIGASDDLRKPGARVLRNIVAHGFAGEVFPVSLHAAVVQGLPAHAAVEELPTVPDLVVISVPIAQALEVFQDCARLGVSTVVMLSALDVGAREQREAVSRLCEEFPGTRLLGPSSLGVHGAHARFAGSFMTAIDGDFRFAPSGVFIISQSGGVGAYLLSTAHAAGLPVGGFISTGIEADLTLAEILRDVIDRYTPSLVCIYLEGARDEGELVSALEHARTRGAPVLLLRAGVTVVGRAVAERHSGLPSLAEEVWNECIDPVGGLGVESMEEMIDVGRAIVASTALSGERVSIVSASGGAGVLMADAAVRCGFVLAEWNAEEKAALADFLPAHATVENPIDATGAIFSPLRTLGRVLGACMAHPGTDVTILTLGNMPHVDERLFHEIATAARTRQGALVAVWAGGSSDAIRRLAEGGVLAFSDPVRCARALRRARDHPAGVLRRPAP